MQHGQPGLALRVEATRRDGAQAARGRLFAVLAVHVQQQVHARHFPAAEAPAAQPPEHGVEGGAQRGHPAPADAGHALQPSIVGGDLKRFEAVYLQGVVDALRELRADTGNRAKQLRRIEAAAQLFQPAAAAGSNDFIDHAGDSAADMRQFAQPLDTLVFGDGLNIAVQPAYGFCRTAIGIDAKRIGLLLFEQIGLNKRESKDMIDAFFDLIAASLVEGQDVKISGFGNFQIRTKAPRPGRNPRTGEAIPIEARRVVTFHASHKLKEQIQTFGGGADTDLD